MSGVEQILTEIEPILPGLITAAIFLVVLVALRLIYRGEKLAEKLRFPSALFLLYLAMVVPVVLTRAYWPATAGVLGVIALFILALAVILAASFGIFDLFLGRYRNVQVAAILRDILVLVVFVITIFVVLGNRGVDLTSILTTSAVLTAIVGFALQDLLSNIISGLALQIERPFKEGDSVRFGEQEGVVLEINWRSTKIKTLHNDIVVIPNNVITRSEVINFTSPSRIHRRRFTIGLRYEVPPNRVRASLLAAVRRVEGVLVDPEPYVLLVSYDDFAMRERIEDEVRTHVWYQLKRDGLTVPFPTRDLTVKTISDEDEVAEREQELDRVVEFLSKVRFLEPLSVEERRRLAAGTKREYFAGGERVISAGDEGDTFYVISEGEVDVCVGDDLQVVAQLSVGDYFGEMSLMTGEARTATIVTRCDSEYYVIDRGAFRSIIASNDSLVAAISDKLESRRDSLDETQRQRESSILDRTAAGGTDSIVNRIRRFFNIR